MIYTLIVNCPVMRERHPRLSCGFISRIFYRTKHDNHCENIRTYRCENIRKRFNRPPHTSFPGNSLMIDEIPHPVRNRDTGWYRKRWRIHILENNQSGLRVISDHEARDLIKSALRWKNSGRDTQFLIKTLN